MKSPIKGMNLIRFIAADLLFLVIANNKPVIMALGMSPIGGMPRIGPSIKSKASAITDIPRAGRARHTKEIFSTFSLCMIYQCTI
ncbi:MAG: hypothetical protein M3Y53_02870, partial [Thermoproteota archaeon]|nr:hypothetical protein [Thermoproteota archaeon]